MSIPVTSLDGTARSGNGMVKGLLKAVVASLVMGYSGCVSPDISVVDLDSGRTRHPPSSGMRQVVVSVNTKAQTFTTMAKQDASFCVQTFDSSCRRVSQHVIPAFVQPYCGTVNTCYAFSEDGSKLAYLKRDTRNLYLYDIATQKETVLLTGVAGRRGQVPYLDWISNSEILMAFAEDVHASDQSVAVVVLDVGSRVSRTVYRPTVLFESRDIGSFGRHYSLTSDRSLLAFTDFLDAEHRCYVIKVLDIRRGKLLAILGNGLDSSDPCWNSGGTELAYLEGQKLWLWRITETNVRALRGLPNQLFCRGVFCGQGIAGYIMGEYHRADSSLVVLNSTNGEELRVIDMPLTGSTFALNGNTIICETGF